MDYEEEISVVQPFYSYHVFLFSFDWKLKSKDGKKFLLEEQTQLKDFCREMDSTSRWKRSIGFYPPKTILYYNEANYFHKFVHPALYDTEKEDSFLTHYSYILSQPAQYVIKTGEYEYALDIESILLHVYSSGVGVLSFHLYNRSKKQSSPNDILRINQFGRRIFPPFVPTETEKVGSQEFFESRNFGERLAFDRGELANEIKICQHNKPDITEDFYQSENNYDLYRIPRHISTLFSAGFFSSIEFQPTLDDRMFVLCWYGNAKLTEELNVPIDAEGKTIDKVKVKDVVGKKEFTYGYCNNDWWYKFLFVDNPKDRTHRDKEVTWQLLKEQTNARWAEYGTLYGVTRYSFVSLTPEVLKFYMNAVIASHMMTMYYKLAELCLVQRSCIIRFSDEVTSISSLEPEKGLTSEVASLYKQYIRFVNKIYFREVTAQEQGIELYDLLQKSMRIEQNVKDLDTEISELHDYVSMREQQKQAAQQTTLTTIATYALPFTVVFGILGANIFSGSMQLEDSADWNAIYWLLIGSGISALLILTIKVITKKK